MQENVSASQFNRIFRMCDLRYVRNIFSLVQNQLPDHQKK